MLIDDKICGVVMTKVKVISGPSFSKPSTKVIEVELGDGTNSSYCFVLSKKAAQELAHQLYGKLI